MPERRSDNKFLSFHRHQARKISTGIVKVCLAVCILFRNPIEFPKQLYIHVAIPYQCKMDIAPPIHGHLAGNSGKLASRI